LGVKLPTSFSYYLMEIWNPEIAGQVDALVIGRLDRKNEQTIGSALNSDLRITHRSVAPFQASLRVKNGRLYIADEALKLTTMKLVRWETSFEAKRRTFFIENCYFELHFFKEKVCGCGSALFGKAGQKLGSQDSQVVLPASLCPTLPIQIPYPSIPNGSFSQEEVRLPVADNLSYRRSTPQSNPAKTGLSSAEKLQTSNCSSSNKENISVFENRAAFCPSLREFEDTIDGKGFYPEVAILGETLMFKKKKNKIEVYSESNVSDRFPSQQQIDPGSPRSPRGPKDPNNSLFPANP